MTLFEAVLDLGFEPFAVIPSSTSIYHDLNKINMTLAYSHKINPCVFFSWVRNQPCNFFFFSFFLFFLLTSVVKSDHAKTEEYIYLALAIPVLPGGTLSVVLKELLLYLKSQG